MSATHRVVAGDLEVAFRQDGPADGPVVIVLHGFPYDVHAYDEVAARLHPTVVDANVVGIPHERFGESVALVCSVSEPTSADDIVASSPVVPSATSPVAPSERSRTASRSSESRSSAPSRSKGVTSGTQIPLRSMPSGRPCVAITP